MALVFTMTGEAIEEDQVKAFERKNGFVLPDDYREFLLRHNGGRPQPACSWIPKSREAVIIDYLYGIRKHKDLDLQPWLDEYGDELPSGFLVIGHDPGAAMFILGTEEPDRGVYFWDHQHRFPGSSEENGNTFLLAESFQTWLDSLRELPDDK